jgi:micrococcal nuclease
LSLVLGAVARAIVVAGATLSLTGCLAAPPVATGAPTSEPGTAPTANTVVTTPAPVAAAGTPPPAPTRTSAPTVGWTLLPNPSPTAAPTPTSEPTPSPTPTLVPSPSTTPAQAALAPTGRTQEARVVRVVDGDTIRVQFGGQEYPLRYIGIDTPETVHPSRPVEWMGREASDANKTLVAGRTVVLERDVSETDRYGRLLRYVWLAEGAGWLLVNLELVRRGFAQVSTYPPDVKYTDLFLDAQREARDEALGLWGDPPEIQEPEGPADGPGRGDGCDPAYPDVCIPKSPPDLDCGDIPHRRFKVLPPDPHRFDGDGDGLGCESG